MDGMENKKIGATMTTQVKDSRLHRRDRVARSTQPCRKGDRIADEMNEAGPTGNLSARFRVHCVGSKTIFDAR